MKTKTKCAILLLIVGSTVCVSLSFLTSRALTVVYEAEGQIISGWLDLMFVTSVLSVVLLALTPLPLIIEKFVHTQQ